MALTINEVRFIPKETLFLCTKALFIFYPLESAGQLHVDKNMEVMKQSADIYKTQGSLNAIKRFREDWNGNCLLEKGINANNVIQSKFLRYILFLAEDRSGLNHMFLYMQKKLNCCLDKIIYDSMELANAYSRYRFEIIKAIYIHNQYIQSTVSFEKIFRLELEIEELIEML